MDDVRNGTSSWRKENARMTLCYPFVGEGECSNDTFLLIRGENGVLRWEIIEGDC